MKGDVQSRKFIYFKCIKGCKVFYYKKPIAQKEEEEDEEDGEVEDEGDDQETRTLFFRKMPSNFDKAHL